MPHVRFTQGSSDALTGVAVVLTATGTFGIWRMLSLKRSTSE